MYKVVQFLRSLRIISEDFYGLLWLYSNKKGLVFKSKRREIKAIVKSQVCRVDLRLITQLPANNRYV